MYEVNQCPTALPDTAVVFHKLTLFNMSSAQTRLLRHAPFSASDRFAAPGVAYADFCHVCLPIPDASQTIANTCLAWELAHEHPQVPYQATEVTERPVAWAYVAQLFHSWVSDPASRASLRGTVDALKLQHFE